MNVGESIRTGFVEIWSHKTRSFLSFSSIAFGVAAILYTFVQVNNMLRRQTATMELTGPGRMEVQSKEPLPSDTAAALSRGLTMEDSDAIRQALPWLHMISPRVFAGAEIRDGEFKSRETVEGVTTDWKKRGWNYTLRGRFIDEYDIETAARVVVLKEPPGWAGKKPFWAKWTKPQGLDDHVLRADMLGKVIQIGTGYYTVIGTIRPPPYDRQVGWRMGWGRSGDVIAPITTVQRYLAQASDNKSPDAVDSIALDTGSMETTARARRRVEALLSGRHRGAGDFEVEEWREMFQQWIESARKDAVAALAVGAVAILAGGVGIMNVTLATIFSRIREIGVRRALGATRADILVQFLTEAALLGLLGGVAGSAIGVAGLKWLVDERDRVMEALAWWHFPATLLISIGTALIFAIYPAYQASRLDPVEALRYE